MKNQKVLSNIPTRNRYTFLIKIYYILFLDPSSSFFFGFLVLEEKRKRSQIKTKQHNQTTRNVFFFIHILEYNISKKEKEPSVSFIWGNIW